MKNNFMEDIIKTIATSDFKKTKRRRKYKLPTSKPILVFTTNKPF